MTRLSYLFVITCVTCLGSSAVAETYLVNPEGTGDFETIQDALSGVENGDVIELGNGTFTGPGNRDVNWYAQEVTVRSQSGNPEACIIDCEGSESEPHRAFRFRDSVGTNAVIESITITGGWYGTSCAGAILVGDNASPTIRNCRIIDNFSECVGGIAVFHGSPVIFDCHFEGNECGVDGDGAAIFVSGNSSPLIDDCSFVNNYSPVAGAIIVRFTGTPTITDCLFVDNRAIWGGAVVCNDDAIVVMENCTFVGNEAPTGANIQCRAQSSLTITNSILANSQGGEAIECAGTSIATLSCCDVWGNAGDDWTGCIAGQEVADGNLSVDPCFCLDSYYIAETSPCASANNSCGVLIGALDEQCVDCGGDVPVLDTTWGQLKAGYR